MKQNKLFIALIFTLVFLTLPVKIFAQCGCSGAPIGGVTPVGATASLSSQNKGSFFASVYYLQNFGEHYYAGDVFYEKGYIHQISAKYIGLIASYGLSRDFSIEAESGYYFQKSQEIVSYSLQTSGLSHISISGKANIYNDLSNKSDVYAGGGIKLPLSNFSTSTDDNYPQHLKTSTGAIGLFLSGLYRQGFTGTDLNLYIISRFDYGFENYKGYRYGPTLITSILTTKQIISDLTATLEIRNEYRSHDYDKKAFQDSTGSCNVVLSPGLSYKSGKLIFNINFDYPIYKYYFGSQPAEKYALLAGLSIKL